MSADATPTTQGSGVESHDAASPAGNPAITTTLPLRMRTNTAEIDSTITHPGSVKINVKGAFIVDVEDASPNGHSSSGGGHHDKDIRLPNHTAVVSHIAVDVCLPTKPFEQTTYGIGRLEVPWLSWSTSRGNRTPGSRAEG